MQNLLESSNRDNFLTLTEKSLHPETTGGPVSFHLWSQWTEDKSHPAT